MDVYKLINSRAIADHCRKIKHQFNTEELAVLIYRNKYMSVDEKIQAYNELITDYPDIPVLERFNCRNYDSIRDLIKSEITRLNTLVDKLKLDEPDVVYTYEAYYKSISMYRDYSKIANLYKTFSETITAVTEEITEDDDVLMFKLYKTSLTDDFPNIVAKYTVNEDNKIKMVNLYDTKHIDLDIDNIFINIPTPFKRGDILVSYGNVPAIDGVLPDKKEIFVLDYLFTWREDLKEKLAKGNFDSSDMYRQRLFFI